VVTVNIHCPLSENFRQSPGGIPAVEIHLEESVRGMEISQGIKQIIPGSGLDAGNSPLIPCDGNRIGDPPKGDFPFYPGQGVPQQKETRQHYQADQPDGNQNDFFE
jgi:hypothetical protein